MLWSINLAGGYFPNVAPPKVAVFRLPPPPPLGTAAAAAGAAAGAAPGAAAGAAAGATAVFFSLVPFIFFCSSPPQASVPPEHARTHNVGEARGCLLVCTAPSFWSSCSCCSLVFCSFLGLGRCSPSQHESHRLRPKGLVPPGDGYVSRLSPLVHLSPCRCHRRCFMMYIRVLLLLGLCSPSSRCGFRFCRSRTSRGVTSLSASSARTYPR